MSEKQRRQGDWLSVMEDQAASAVLYLTRCMHGRIASEYELTGMNFRAPQNEMGEVLAILKSVSDDGTPVVAFHSAATFGECLVGVASRLRNGTLKWKVDEYARKNQG